MHFIDVQQLDIGPRIRGRETTSPVGLYLNLATPLLLPDRPVLGPGSAPVIFSIYRRPTPAPTASGLHTPGYRRAHSTQA